MSLIIYDELERCTDFNEIDNILIDKGYDTALDKYTYLINRMGIVAAQFTGIPDDDFDTMYNLARENYLLNHWRAEDDCEESN